MLLAAIADIQGSIRANDAKHSAALITHGLLFAGTTNVAVQLAPSYKDAWPILQIVGWLAIVVAAGAFGASLAYVLKALAPHRPEVAAMRSPRVAHRLHGTQGRADLRRCLPRVRGRRHHCFLMTR